MGVTNVKGCAGRESTVLRDALGGAVCWQEHLCVVRGLREEEITGLLNTGWRDSVRDVIGEGAAAVGAGLVGFGRAGGAACGAVFAAIRPDWEVMFVSELLGKKVLLATDGSEGAEPAARAAVEVAEGTGSALHVVYVEPLPDFVKNGDGAPGYDHELYEKIEEEARERLRKLTWRVKVGGGTVAEAHLRMGAVADEIVDLADQLGAGLIVVGSRGLGMMRRALGGSVSESVVRHAPCPVMVVRTKSGRPGRRGGGGLRVRRAFSQEAIPAAIPWVREPSCRGRGAKSRAEDPAVRRERSAAGRCSGTPCGSPATASRPFLWRPGHPDPCPSRA